MSYKKKANICRQYLETYEEYSRINNLLKYDDGNEALLYRKNMLEYEMKIKEWEYYNIRRR